MAGSPLRATWELHTPAGVAETWALFSDTERFNRTVGFGFRFEEEPVSGGTTRRYGSARFLGMNLRWEELPFQYRDLQWYKWERIFQGGPAERLTGTLRLKPKDGGTDVLYTIEVTPKNAFVRPAVAFELYLRTKPKIDRALADLLALLAGGSVVLEPLPDALGPAEAATLNGIVSRLPDPAFAAALARFIDQAPLSEQDSISPLRLARDWGMPPDQAIRGCLSAVREGALTLSWDLLCPLCQSPKQKVQRLSQAGRVHCPACNITYDGTFADSVSVRFRTAPTLRAFEVHTACVGSPARQPHVVAQDRVEGAGTLRLELELQPGLYRLRSFPPRDTASISVGDEGPTGVEVPLGGEAAVSGRLELKRGLAAVAVANQGQAPLQVLLERRSLPRDALTVGQLLEVPGATELLPDGALDPTQRSETLRAAVLALELPGAERQRLERERDWLLAQGARAVQIRDAQLVATFPRLSSAVDVASAMTHAPGCRLAIGLGPVVEVQVAEGGTAQLGRAVDRALVSLWGANPGRPAIDAALADDPELTETLDRLGARLDRVGLPVSPTQSVHWLKLPSARGPVSVG